MSLFTSKKIAEKAASKRRKGFRATLKREKRLKKLDSSRVKFLRESIKTVKVRKLTGKPIAYEVIGR